VPWDFEDSVELVQSFVSYSVWSQSKTTAPASPPSSNGMIDLVDHHGRRVGFEAEQRDVFDLRHVATLLAWSNSLP
jgi:hypothetical protein